jgi:hypothetical protein
METKMADSKFQIVIPNEIVIRARSLIVKVDKTEVVALIKFFNLWQSHSPQFFKLLISLLQKDKQYFAAANVLIETNLIG